MLIGASFHLNVFAQITPEAIESYLSSEIDAGKKYHTDPISLKAFYKELNYKTAWIQKENAGNFITFVETLNRAYALALDPNDYQFDFIESFKINTLKVKTVRDSIEADILVSDAAIHFFSDIAFGNTKPGLGYYGIKYLPACHDISTILANHIANHALPAMIQNISSKLPEIDALLAKIRWIQAIVRKTDFKELTVLPVKTSNSNTPLILKLYQLGVTDSFALNIPDTTLKQKIKEAQRQFCLLADGTLRSTFLQELNIPVRSRLKQLTLAVNYYRWLSCLQQSEPVIVVNIPAAYLKVYEKDKVILEMRIVVGKKSTPTPTLSSTIDEVILYPYWHVPAKIATKELLPIIKRNPGYLEENNYQVLNKSGNIVDPARIKWRALSRNYFPYILRQSTGCDNSLGLLKLNFYSPFGVYLHDTPLKNYFMLNKRYFSHGCMRMEKPIELAHMILPNNSIAIDTLTQKGCLLNQSPIIVPADRKTSLVVWYNPVGIDSNGRILFFEDIYEKFNGMK